MNDANQALHTVAHRTEIVLYCTGVMVAGLWLKSSALSQDRYGEDWGWYPMVVGTITSVATLFCFIFSALALRKARLASEESDVQRKAREYS